MVVVVQVLAGQVELELVGRLPRDTRVRLRCRGQTERGELREVAHRPIELHATRKLERVVPADLMTRVRAFVARLERDVPRSGLRSRHYAKVAVVGAGVPP